MLIRMCACSCDSRPQCGERPHGGELPALPVQAVAREDVAEEVRLQVLVRLTDEVEERASHCPPESFVWLAVPSARSFTPFCLCQSSSFAIDVRRTRRRVAYPALDPLPSSVLNTIGTR